MRDLKKGFGLGVGILGGELAVFFGQMVINEFYGAISAFSPSPSVDSIYNTATIAFIIISISGYLIGFLIGLRASAAFAVGYIAGDYLLLLFVCKVLWSIAQSVVISMALIPLCVGLGIYFKNKYSRKDDSQYWY